MSVYLSVWSFYPHHALILGDVLIKVWHSTWINASDNAHVSLFCYFCVVYLWSCGELTLCGDFPSSFHCANTSYSRYHKIFLFYTATQVYGCIPKGHVEYPSATNIVYVYH